MRYYKCGAVSEIWTLKSLCNSTQGEKVMTKSLSFGVVFANRKLVPNRVELVNILQKVQIVELVILT